jgi:large subunit ribosomal protein L9
MKVILLKDVKGIGKKDQIVTVKDGYAANYLIPHGLAVSYSTKSLEILDKQKADAAEEVRQNTLKAQEVAKKLETITLEFEAQCGADSRMFGSISTKQIEQELKAKYGIEIDKRKFIDKVAVDRLGYTKLHIELYKGVIGIVTVHVSEKK